MPSATPGPTTGEQSHHYLRLSLALIVLALFTAIGVYLVASKGNWLPSISHYFYTPAHNVFVAALIAAAVALAALAGRDLETIFLDVASVFAPLIALVPTGISATALGTITGKSEGAVTTPCDSNGTDCIPAGYISAIDNGIVTYMIVVVVVVVVTVLIRAKLLRDFGDPEHRRREFFAAFTAPAIALLAVAGVGCLAFVSPANTGFPFNGPFGLSVHFAATILFFGTFTAVPLINAIRWIRERIGGESPYKTRYVVVYIAVPVLMLVDIGLLIWFVDAQSTGSEVMVCEAVALALFAGFWVAQTVQRWHESNPESYRIWGYTITSS